MSNEHCIPFSKHYYFGHPHAFFKLSISNTQILILTEAPLRFVLKVFSVLCSRRARRRLLGPNCSSEFCHYDGAFGETIPTHCE